MRVLRSTVALFSILIPRTILASRNGLGRTPVRKTAWTVFTCDTASDLFQIVISINAHQK